MPVVVGAGYAGLAAARKLTEEGRSTLVLEARDRIGGRIHSVDEAGARVDLGGQWLGPGQDRAYGLAREMGVATFPQWTAGSDVVLQHGEARGEEAYDPDDLAEYASVVAAVEELAAEVPIDQPWAAPDAQELDAVTVGSWLADHATRPGAREMLANTVATILATEPCNFSLLHLLFYIRSGGGWESLVATEGGAQQDRVVGGLQEPAIRLASRLGDTIHLGWPVRRISQDAGEVVVTGEAGEVRARRAIVAIPPTLAGRLVYDPPLPARRDQLTQRLPAGSIVKVHLVYGTPWWREQGLSGFVYAPDEPVPIMFDGTPAEPGPGALLGLVEGAKGVELGALGSDERRRRVIEHAVRAFGKRAGEPIGYVDRDWSAEEWTRGCYGGHFPPGTWTQFGPTLREPVGRIHWAGTETAERWMGYVDGAIESGSRAAAEVLEDGPQPEPARPTRSARLRNDPDVGLR